MSGEVIFEPLPSREMTQHTQLQATEIRSATFAAVRSAKVWDFHTHLFSPAFGSAHGRGVTPDQHGLMSWGIDELLTYHYLIAEVLRESVPDGLTPDAYYTLPQSEQADLVWRKLFVEATPLSEACRGVITTLTRLGLDPNEPSLDGYRKWFAEQSPEEQTARVLDLAGVETVTMTNELFDDGERQRWLDDPAPLLADSRFKTVLRFDHLVVAWEEGAERLRDWGYKVQDTPSDACFAEVRRFLGEWADRIDPVYCAMSLPPDWRYPRAEDAGTRCLTEAILPFCEERGLPLALMIGVTRQLNPALRMAGDTLGLADVRSVAALCKDFPNQRLLVTMLARENQHELAVTARKFPKLTPFGCWWFVNNPSLIEEITRMRFELLGPTFIPQHSDCRVLEQLLYKWDHSREIIAEVLADKYEALDAAGWTVTAESIERDAQRLLRGNVASLLG